MATWQARAGRSATVLLVLAAAAMGPAQPAQAAADVHVSPPLLQSNWYWHKLVAAAPVVVADPGEPSLVPAGDLPVASQDTGTPAKCSIVAFNLLGAGPGSSISKFAVTLTVDPGATNLMLEAPQLVAGIGQRNWFSGTGGEADTTNAPPILTSALIPGVWSSDGKSVTFTVNEVAQNWIDDANYGLEIIPLAGYTTPFQVSFLGNAVKATMVYTPGSAETPVVDLPAAVPPADVGTPAVPPVASVPVIQPPLGGPVVSGPVTAPVPSVPAPTTTVPAAATLPEVSGRPSAGLFWSGVALLALLVVMSLILGGEPRSAAAVRPSRLTTVLRSRSATLHARAATV